MSRKAWQHLRCAKIHLISYHLMVAFHCGNGGGDLTAPVRGEAGAWLTVSSRGSYPQTEHPPSKLTCPSPLVVAGVKVSCESVYCCLLPSSWPTADGCYLDAMDARQRSHSETCCIPVLAPHQRSRDLSSSHNSRTLSICIVGRSKRRWDLDILLFWARPASASATLHHPEHPFRPLGSIAAF